MTIATRVTKTAGPDYDRYSIAGELKRVAKCGVRLLTSGSDAVSSKDASQIGNQGQAKLHCAAELVA
jgi:hypothetical protein